MKKLLAIVLVTLQVATCYAAEFRGIPAESIVGSYSYSIFKQVVQVSAISGDGTTIGGSLIQTAADIDCASFDCSRSAFVWTHHYAKPRPLGELEFLSNMTAYPKAVSALSFDGSTALTDYNYGQLGLHRDDAITHLRQTVEVDGWLTGFDMSSDASVVVGSSGENPFRWTEESGMTQLSGIAAETGFSATTISGDGSTIVLNDRVSGNVIAVGWGRRNSMSWTESDGPAEFQPLKDYAYSNATSISHDGSIIAGSSTSSSFPYDSQATIWIDSQPIALGSGNGSSIVLDVSADGKSAVGWLDPTNPLTNAFFHPEAMLWRDGESHRLKDLLVNEYRLGDSIQGWNLTSATAISDNGTVIAGQGISPDGQQSAWVVILSVPEPNSFAIASLAVVVLVSAMIRMPSSRCD